MKKERRIIRDERSFLLRLAQLLEEGWTLPNSFELLLPHFAYEPNETEQLIESELKKGVEVAHLFIALGYKKQDLLSLANAKSRDQLIRALRQVAERLGRLEVYRQLLRKTFTYPLILFSFLVFFFVLFELLFIPHLETLFATRVDVQTGLSYWLPFIAVYWPKVFLVGVLLLFFFVVIFYRRLRAMPMKDKVSRLLRIPFLSFYTRMSWTYRFAYALSQLTAIGWTVQESVYQLMTQKYDPWVAYFSEEIYAEMKEGLPLNKVLERQPYWLGSFGPTTAHGFDRAMLTEELSLYASLLEEEADEYFSKVLRIIHPTMLGFIASTIILFYLSMMLPIYQMFDHL